MNRQDPRPAHKRSLIDDPSASAAASYEAGILHLQAGRHADAETCCREVLAREAGHADALHLMGQLSFHAKQYDLAVEWIALAIRQQPKAVYLSSLGTTLQHQGRAEDALKAFDKAVQLKPDDAELWHNLGNILLELKRPDDALLSYQHALELSPRYWDAANKCGVLLFRARRWDEGLAMFNLSDELKPNHAPTLQLRALCLRGLKRFADYLSDSERAYALDPTSADSCNNIGDALLGLARYEDALPWFDRAVALRPNFVQTLNNKAFALSQLRRFDEAFAIYDELKAIDPDNAVTAWNLSLLQMLTGDFEAGWAGREARWKASVLPVAYPEFSEPMWLGAEDIAGKTVLVHVDEGLGDTIQFARYVPMLAARGARVILVVADAARPLLTGLNGVAQCLGLSQTPLPAFDVHCPISSLPLVFGTRLDTIPSQVPYLPLPAPARVQAWEERLPPHDRLRVGLVWSGSTGHANDHNRSIPLRMMARILDTDATFVSLQKDPRDADRATLGERTDIIDLGAHLTDFGETAALVCCLDLVITVDTSVAHLAGALGRPTWILLPYTPDYRWLLDRDDSPWYPTVRLFRQTATQDYASVLDRVRTELQALVTTAARARPALPASPPVAGIAPHAPAQSAAAALSAAGHGHLRAGRLRDAQLCGDQALSADPGDADTLHLMGLLALHARQYDLAVEWMSRALRQGPKADYLSSLGSVLHQQGRHDDALKAFDKAVQLAPENPELWRNLGKVLVDLQRPDDAILSYRQALALDPRHWDTACRSGILLRGAGRMEEALACFDLCDDVLPDHALTLYLRALTLRDLKRFEEALADIRRAQALDPANADICNTQGAVLLALGREAEALPCFERAVGLRPDFVEALNNKASSLGQLHRFDGAFAIYRDLQARGLNNATTDWNLALLQMLTGDFASGFAGREARWRIPTLARAYPKFSQPMWRGEPVEGKTVLIGADEGLGDAIQFARYVPMVAARGARVILFVNDPLCPVLADLPGVSLCLPKTAKALPAFDTHCPMSSLPLAFGTRLESIPCATPYLPPPEADHIAAWDRRLPPHTRLRVGLVWSGSTGHDNDRNRSIPLRTLAPLLDADATFVSLQKDPRAADQATLRERPDIVDLTADLADFGETAALVSCLDLVITVDTAVAHLAGALGRPTWILLPYTPDYRWLLGRDDSPWYPSVRLFRQDDTRDYGAVLDRVRGELLARIAAFKAAQT